jgi:hypothetical protein
MGGFVGCEPAEDAAGTDENPVADANVGLHAEGGVAPAPVELDDGVVPFDRDDPAGERDAHGQALPLMV